MPAGLQGYGLTQTVDSEIVAAYAAAQSSVPAVGIEPGWVTVGAFMLPKLVTARLEVIAFVSDGSLTGVARLWSTVADPQAEVSGSRAGFSSVGLDETVRSGSFEIPPGRYLVQAQIVGGTGTSKFGVVHTASLVGP